MVRDRRTRSIGFGTVALVALGLVAMGLALRAGLSSDPVVVAAAAPRLASNASPLLTPTVLDAAIVRTAAPTASTVSAAISSPIAADTTNAAPVAGSSSASTASTIAATTFSTTRPAVTVSRITTVATSSAAGASSTTPTASTTSTASATSTSASSSTPNATTVVPTATTPAASTSTPPGSSASSTTAAGPARSVDLTVAASFVGPLVEGRAAFVTITVGNGGPDTAWAPQVSIDLPTAFTEVSSLDPAWSCTVTGSTATCGGSQLEVGTSSVWVLRGTLRSDIVLQSSRTRSAPAVVAPPPLRFRVTDGSGGVDLHPDSNVVSLSFGAIASGGLGSLDVRMVHGGLAVAANSLLTCDRTEPSCAAALVSGDNADARVVPTNTLAASVVGTTASSSATLTLREGATVAQAWLIWGAVSLDGSALPRLNLGTAWLSTPAVPAEMVTPTFFQTTGTNDFYARANVTNRVRAAGSGSFGFGLVGGLAGLSGTNQSAGWALVVVYAHPSEPMRTVLVMDGLQVMGGGPATTVSLGSLSPATATPTATPAAAQVAIVAFDGDRGQADLACINGVRLGDTANPTTAGGGCDQLFPTDDLFNATISVDGVASQNAQSGTTTFLGFDADLFSTVVPRVSASSFVVRATADVVRIGFFALAFRT